MSDPEGISFQVQIENEWNNENLLLQFIFAETQSIET